jgi:hypothetical protein
VTLTIRRLVYIAFFIETGLLLVVLPWSSFWSRNYFVMHWPAVAPWLVNDFVRGAVTGLGVVNLCAGVADSMTLFRRPVRHGAERERGPVRHSAEREGG